MKLQILDVVRRVNSSDPNKLWEVIDFDEDLQEFELTDGWKYRYESGEGLEIASRTPHTNV